MSARSLVNLLFEAGTLRKIARSHRQHLLTDDLSDNISSHSYRVTVIDYLLARMEKAGANKVVLMCLFHDFSETRSGDQNWVHKRYVKVYEDEIASSQFTKNNETTDIFNLLQEYSKRESMESKIVKDADLLDQMLILREHEWNGNKEATRWMSDKGYLKRLVTKSAKKLATEIYKQNPSDWWENLWTADRR